MRYLRLFRRPAVIIGAVVAALLLALGIYFGPLLIAGPRIVAITPADATEYVNPQGSIRIEFSQWIKRDSVLEALSLDPPAEFVARWERTAVTLEPKVALQRGQQYRLTIKPGIRNVLGRASGESQIVAFSTMPYVAVTNFRPEQAAGEVARRAPITVEFDLPVVPADVIAQAAEDPNLAESLPQPLALEPATSGVGRWLAPTLYGFYPTDGLLLATSYTATVRREISGDGRVQLEQPVAWSFSTEALVLLGARPYADAAEVPAQTPIEVRLEPGVDPQSAGSHFVLQRVDTGSTVDGSIQLADQGFQFVPAAALERGGRFVGQLSPGFLSLAGARLNARPLTWSFTVIGDLEVDQVAPAAGTTEVLTSTRQISVRFNHPVVALTSLEAQASLPQPLTISPALPGVGRWLDTSTYIYSPTTALAPSTNYQVRVQAGLQDQTAGSLQADYAWEFSTILPQVADSLPAPGETQASPLAPLTIEFNQPMDADSLRANTTLRNSATQAPVAGTLQVAGSSATFTPNQPLDRDGYYELRVAAGTSAVAGQATLSEEYNLSFRVAPLPELLFSEPNDGGTLDYGNVQFTFSTPLDWNTLERILFIET